MRSFRLGPVDEGVSSSSSPLLPAGFQRLCSLPTLSLTGSYVVPTLPMRSSAAGLAGSSSARGGDGGGDGAFGADTLGRGALGIGGGLEATGIDGFDAVGAEGVGRGAEGGGGGLAEADGWVVSLSHRRSTHLALGASEPLAGAERRSDRLRSEAAGDSRARRLCRVLGAGAFLDAFIDELGSHIKLRSVGSSAPRLTSLRAWRMMWAPFRNLFCTWSRFVSGSQS